MRADPVLPARGYTDGKREEVSKYEYRNIHRLVPYRSRSLRTRPALLTVTIFECRVQDNLAVSTAQLDICCRGLDRSSSTEQGIEEHSDGIGDQSGGPLGRRERLNSTADGSSMVLYLGPVL